MSLWRFPGVGGDERRVSAGLRSPPRRTEEKSVEAAEEALQGQLVRRKGPGRGGGGGTGTEREGRLIPEAT